MHLNLPQSTFFNIPPLYSGCKPSFYFPPPSLCAIDVLHFISLYSMNPTHISIFALIPRLSLKENFK